MTSIAIDIVAAAPPPPRAAPVSTGSNGFEKIIERMSMRDPDTDAQPQPPAPPAEPAPQLPVDRQDVAGGDEDADVSQLPVEAEGVESVPIWLPIELSPAILPLQAKAVLPAAALAVELPAAVTAQVPASGIELSQLSLERQTLDLNKIAAPQSPADAKPSIDAAALELQAIAAKLDAAPVPALPAQNAVAALAAAVLPALAERFGRSERAASELSLNLEAPAALGGPSQTGTIQRVEAPSPASSLSVDTARADWIEAMIEQIDEFQAQQGARSTQIRLAPDMLGVVDVRIRNEGGQLHVNFAAENAAARTLLSDAAPRLAELAEARGLKLGDTGVGSQLGREKRADSPEADSRTPNRAPNAADDQSTTRADARIA